MLKNLGEHRLRDLGTPMLVWQLGSAAFPPLRTLDELPGNLPVQRTSFIGRVDEVKALASLVEHERLVTLTGPGGVGKSRLALQAAAEVAAAFRDGVWFVSLGALDEVALVSATILEALGVPERRGEPALDTLCSWASTREAMVVIDNCEHLAAEVAAVIDRMLEASATVAIMATSQTPLGVRGEHVWAVAPLPGGVSRDSVELFVDRARMVRTNFELTESNEAAVIEICERLDHVPLAIELAAARVRGMTPADIARRLDQRLRLLSSSDRSAPGRHRTLDAAVRWSYELCDDTQRKVFDRLSVFAGPFTIDAAEAVAAGDGIEEWEVLDAVLALVDKSLVVANENDEETRYRLLETMRQFGQANLVTAGAQARYREPTPISTATSCCRAVPSSTAPETWPRSWRSNASSKIYGRRCATRPMTSRRRVSTSSSVCSSYCGIAIASWRVRRGLLSSSGSLWSIPRHASWRSASPHSS